MNRIIRSDRRYTSKRVEATQEGRVFATHVFNLIPGKPRLGFIVEECDVSGNPIDILSQLAKNPKYAALRPLTAKTDRFPNVSLKTERGSARDFLNEMVRQHPGLTWHCLPGGIILRYIPKPVARQVDLVYPEMRRGKPTNLSFKYELVWDKVVYGIPTVVVEKHKVPPRP